MELIRFADPSAYYQHAQAFLLAHEAEHCLPIGICTTLIVQTDYWGDAPYLAVVQDGEQVIAAAMRTPPHNIVLSLIAPEVLARAIELLARDLYAAYATVPPGVVGPSHVSRVFAEHWHVLTEQAYHLARNERLYKLEHVRPAVAVPGSIRQPTDADRELLIRWMEGFDSDTGVTTPDIALWVDRALAGPPDLRALYLWGDGEPVSLVGYSGPTPHGMRIGPVYTPREHRGHGYASALTAAVSQMLLESGRQFVCLFTDLANPTANHIYQEIGYRPVGDVDEYRFSS